MRRWTWGLTSAPDGSHHLEHQSMTGWERAAWATAFAVGVALAPVSLWPLLTVVLYFVWFPGWQRRWVRIDDRFVRVGWTVFARGDIVGVRVADRAELRLTPDRADRFVSVPTPSNVRVRAGIPRGVLVKTRTPEGQDHTYALSSWRPERLAEALGREIPAPDLRGLHRWEEPITPPETTLETWAASEPTYRGRESGGGAQIAAVLAAPTALLLVAQLYGEPAGIGLGLLMFSVPVIFSLWARRRARQPIEIRGGLLCTRQVEVPLPQLRSLRMVGPPELGWFRRGLDPFVTRGAPWWMHHAAVITTGPAPATLDGDQPFPTHLLQHGRLPSWRHQGGEIILVGTHDPEVFEAALLAAREHAVAGRPFRPDAARQVSP